MAVLFGVFVQQMAAVVAFTIFSLMCWYYWSHRKILRVAWKMPTVVPTLPVVGHGYFIVRGAEWFVNNTLKLIKDVVMSSSTKKGVFWVGPYPLFMLADPDEIQTVLNSSKSFEKGFERLFLGTFLGNNLFTSPGSVWRVERRHVNPLFHPRNLDLLYPMLNECGRDLVSALTQHVGHGLIEVQPFINLVTLKSASRVVNFFIERIKQYMIYGSSDKGAVWIGPYPIFWISDPEDIHTVLNNTKSMEGGIEKMFLTYALGDGLLTAPGSVWKMTRRHVNPLFHPRNLNLMYPMLNEFGRDLVGNMTQHVGRGLVDAETVVNPIVFKSSCKVVFGIDSYINMSSEKFKNFHKASHRISKLLGERGVRIYAWPELLFNVLYKRDIKQINDSCNTFIAEAFEISKEDYLIKESLRNQAKTLSIDRKDLNNENTSDGRVPIRLEDALKTVKEYIPNFTDQDLINEAKTLIVVGSESIRVTLSSCLLALAAHPHVQEKLYAEIVSVTGTQDGDVTPEHIRAMPYLDQVLKETMRKFLIVPVISRRVKEDLKLKDWTVPQGSIVWTFILGVHFNPRLYPDPERFDPDRFNPENEAARGKYSFIPFSSGPRNCIGKVYANMLLKTLVIHVLKRFKFSTTVNINSRMMVKCGIAFSLQNGYKVEIENRKN